MLQNFITVLCLCLSLVINAHAENELVAIDIPTGDGHSDRLDVKLPLTKLVSTGLTIWNQNGRCVGKIGSIDIDFELPAPCDIMTYGAANYGFKPRVRYNEKSDKPTTVKFQIVGALKYYPMVRAECSDQWRNIELKWPGPKIHVSPLNDNIVGLDGLHCPRSYSDQKVSGLP
jgi:hypothetical protein